MTTLVLLTAVLIVLALLVVLPTLLRSNQSSPTQSDDANLRFLRSRLDELESQLKMGKLSDSEYADLKSDLETNLAAEMAATKKPASIHNKDQSAAHKLSRRTALALMIFIPASVALIYTLVGTPSAISELAVHKQQEPGVDMAEVNAMVAQIETRLQANPDDLEGWSVLARTYLSLGRYANAERAYLQILELQGPSASTYSALADASALANEGQLTGRPIDYINKALELDPQHPQALWLAGLHAVQVGDNQTGKAYWLTLLPLLDQMPERQAELREIIAQMDNNSLLPNNNEASPETIPDTSPDVATSGVTVSITVADSVASKVSLADTVFVVVRAVNGPNAPLAVRRYTVANLPQQLTLTDRDAMVASRAISSFDQIEVLARVSKSGQAIPQAGDLASNPVETTAGTGAVIRLIIDREI